MMNGDNNRPVENICQQLPQQRSNPIKSGMLVSRMAPIWLRNHFKSMHQNTFNLVAKQNRQIQYAAVPILSQKIVF